MRKEENVDFYTLEKKGNLLSEYFVVALCWMCHTNHGLFKLEVIFILSQTGKFKIREIKVHEFQIQD